MTERNDSMENLLAALQERAKELACLYAVEEILGEPDLAPLDACRRIIQAIPPGWQYPAICHARITLHGESLQTDGFQSTPWTLKAQIQVQDRRVGTVEVAYVKDVPVADEGPFLKEEARLIRTIADRIGHFVHHHAMRIHYREWESARKTLKRDEGGNWRIVIDLLSSTDKNLFTKITHKMLNHLCWGGIEEAEALLRDAEGPARKDDDLNGHEANQPERYSRKEFTTTFARMTFSIAEQHLSDETILFLIRKWMQEDRLGFLVRAVERNQALPEVADAIRRYQHIASTEADLSQPARMGVRVSLIRRFLSDQLHYIRIAKEYFSIHDFHGLLQRVIYTNESHGRLGGKAAGMYLAQKILSREREEVKDIGDVRLPNTWHITSDMQLHFMHHNNLDEVAEQKYKDIGQIRFEYPHIVYTCKNSRFPPELVQGLSVALDQLGNVPLVVRSSSVLEDRVGAAFSGKYKSLFVANQGSKKYRLDDLCDAIAEVYASMFGPDPMEYRAERGLLDFSEEMAIIIQEVVGRRVGPYYFPAFAGVALSCNEFRWSPRIRREDGLVRIVPGLGTRSVDRVGDDYPIMFAPGQPNLRVNLSVEETVRYSPRYLDAINMETNEFETVTVADLVRRFPGEFPLANRIVSVNDGGHLRRLSFSDDNVNPDDLVVTFEGLISDQRFVRQAQAILRVLEEKMESPVDIEFAHDGRHLFLLQCRTQTDSDRSGPAPIPQDVPADRVVFSASKHVSNGHVPDVTHIVYVDPERYAALPEKKDLRDVGRAVSRLNKLLPKRQFILMGPGRWGSRGDIKLGVPVGYSDINNTSVLIEIARRTGSYTPDLSFGTHFFQDLTEARIRYLPLYPDEKGNIFNERFLARSPNILTNLAPEFAHLSDTVRVIDVPATTGGLVLKVLLNADLDQALAMLADPLARSTGVVRAAPATVTTTPEPSKDHGPWRMLMVEQIASEIDADRFGVKAFYVFGSVKNQTAGPASDIDVLVHFVGDGAQRDRLLHWLEGWSACLDEMNYLRTGYRAGGLLDVHLVTDEDIANKTSWAVRIGAVTDAARSLPMKRPSPKPAE